MSRASDDSLTIVDWVFCFEVGGVTVFEQGGWPFGGDCLALLVKGGERGRGNGILY